MLRPTRLCAVIGVHMRLGVAKYAAKSTVAAVLSFLPNQAHPDLLATEATLLDGLPRQDRAALSRLLAKLAANLETQNKLA